MKTIKSRMKSEMSPFMPLNLQLFAEPAGGEGGEGGADAGGNGAQGAGDQKSTPEFDYEKLASLISGKQTVTEDTVLKNYFKQQGLTQEEMTSAITAFKEQKAKNTPDVASITLAATQAKEQAAAARLELDVTKVAMELGITSKSLPYVIKMADMTGVTDKDGKNDTEKIKAAINKVLEDVPGLKSQPEQAQGFRVGAANQEGGATPSPKTPNANAKRWNRFNH